MYKLFFLLILLSCKSSETQTEQPSTQFRFKELYVQNKSGLHLRSEPKKNSNSLGLIKQNEQVTLLNYTNQMEKIDSIEGEWYQVKYKDQVGYMFSAYLDIFQIKTWKDKETEHERISKITEFENYKIKYLKEEEFLGKCYLEIIKNSKLICKKTIEYCGNFFMKKDEFYLAKGFASGGDAFFAKYLWNLENCSEKILIASKSNILFDKNGKEYFIDSKKEYLVDKNGKEYVILTETDYDLTKRKYKHKITCDGKIIYDADRVENDSYEIKNCKIKFKKDKN